MKTRWNSWLLCAYYILDNISEVKSFILNINEDNCKPLQKAKSIIQNDTFDTQLLSLIKFRHLTSIIQKFQSPYLTIEQQYQLIEDAKNGLSDVYLDTLNKYLESNSGFQSIKKLRIESRKLFFYAPMTTVDVERSFSVYNDLLSKKRHNLKDINIEKYMVCLYNQNIDEKTTDIEFVSESESESDNDSLMTELGDDD